MAPLSLLLAAIAPPSARAGRDLYIGSAAGKQACASCHGLGGQGGFEGGIPIPLLAGAGLTPDAIGDAVRHGKAKDGRSLSLLMPRRDVTGPECVAIWIYLSDADSAPVPGLSESKFVVRIDASGSMQARLKRQLSASFAAVNASGGVYGRALELRADGDAALRLSLAPGGGDKIASLDIKLAGDTGSAASRFIETDAAVEREILFGEIAREGLKTIVWMDESTREDAEAAATRHDLAMAPSEACGRDGVALVLATAIGALPEACLSNPQVYVLLRSVPAQSLQALFARRPDGLPVEMVAPIPADLSLIADLLSRIVVGTATELGPHASERRLLLAFDRS